MQPDWFVVSREEFEIALGKIAAAAMLPAEEEIAASNF
jgi:hypothetical protein